MIGQIVLDSSVTLAWLFDEDAKANSIKSVMERRDLIAPWLWRLEVTNAVLVRQRRKLLTLAQSTRLLTLLDEFVIELAPEPHARSCSALAELARPHQLSSYNAAYLDLAMRLGLPLFTMDNNLSAAAKRIGVDLIAY